MGGRKSDEATQRALALVAGQTGLGRLQDLDGLCKRARTAGLDYITFKALDGAQDRFLTDSQLEEAKRAWRKAR